MSKVAEKLREDAKERMKNYGMKESLMISEIVDRLYTLQPNRDANEREDITKRLRAFYIIMGVLDEQEVIKKDDAMFIMLIEAALECFPDGDPSHARAPSVPQDKIKQTAIMLRALDAKDRALIEKAVARVFDYAKSQQPANVEMTELENVHMAAAYCIMRAFTADGGKSARELLTVPEDELLDYYSTVADFSSKVIVEHFGTHSSNDPKSAALMLPPWTKRREEVANAKFKALDEPLRKEGLEFVDLVVTVLTKHDPRLTEGPALGALKFAAKIAVLGFNLFGHSVDMNKVNALPAGKHYNHVCQLLKTGLQFAKNISLDPPGETNVSTE